MKKFKIFQLLLYILLTCFSVILFSVGIWTSLDPVINAFYYDLTTEGSVVTHSSNLWIIFIISYISIAFSLLLIANSILMIVILYFENLKAYKIISLIGSILMIFTLTGIILLAKSDNLIKLDKFRNVLYNVMKYKTENYQISVDDRIFMDTIQNTVGCCGDLNADKYVDNKYVPVSCKGYLGIGCVNKSLEYITTRLEVFKGIFGTIFALQIITLFTSIKTIMAHNESDDLGEIKNSMKWLEY